MAARAEPLLHQLQCLLNQADADSCDDAGLWERFVMRRDETAFAALLARHGPMVHGVCRRVLRDEHEAEDAFQAVFLLFARKASCLRHPQTLAAWLYGAARRLALMAQRTNSRRRQREIARAAAAHTGTPSPLDELSARELLLVLDEELGRLPERYRLPLILCGLEGRSQAEAARLLCWSAASVRGRLERGRARLRARLVRRGLALGASLLAMESMTTATVSAALRRATVQKALTFAAGSTEGIAASVLTLAETGITSVTMTKVKVGPILLLTLSLAGGAGALAFSLPGPKQTEEKQATQAKSPEQKTQTPKPASVKAAPTDLYGDPLPAGAIARLGTLRFRHGGGLEDVLFLPDGRRLISAGDNSIELWDVQTGRRLRKIEWSGPRYRVAGIDLSPDGKLLALQFLFQGKTRFWDLASGGEVHPFGDAPDAGRLAFSTDGELLAKLAPGNQKTISIWDIRKGKKIRTIEGGESGSSAVRSIAFSPSDKLLAFPRANGVCVWDVVANKELYQLDAGAKTPMGCVVFSLDSKLLIAACNPYNRSDPDHSIHLWDVTTGKEVGALKGHEDFVAALAMSPKGDLLVSSSWDRTIRFWDLARGKELGRCPGPSTARTPLSFSPDGRLLVSGEGPGVIRLWDTRTREQIPASASVNNCVQWAGFAPDGQTLICTAAEQIGLWEPLTGRPIHIFNCPHLFGSSAALSPDGKSLATTSDRTQGQALLWDVATGKLVHQFGENSQPRISRVTISPDGRRVAGTASNPGVIHVWDAASGKELRQLKGQSYVYSLAFAPDGATLASGSINTIDRGDLTVRLWNLATGEEIWRNATRGWSAFDIRFSSDGRTLALVGGYFGRRNVAGEVRLWEAAAGKELKRFEGHPEHVRCVDFSADGRMLATGSVDNSVRLWEVASGRERACLQGHQFAMSAVSFSPDGRLLASSSADQTALVWDLTGRFRDGRFQPQPLSAVEVESCWKDLGHADAARAYRAIVALWGSPKEAIAFLKVRLSPMTALDSKRLAPLLAALDSDQFAERDKAMAELEKLGLAVEPALREALAAKPSLETRRRIEAIQEKLSAGPRLRLLRTFEILEHIATPEARQLLEAMSKGTTSLWPTQEAKASLERLAKRPAVRP
jgi:RNA polymerase sigma factor (sigma-70 family)